MGSGLRGTWRMAGRRRVEKSGGLRWWLSNSPSGHSLPANLGIATSSYVQIIKVWLEHWEQADREARSKTWFYARSSNSYRITIYGSPLCGYHHQKTQQMGPLGASYQEKNPYIHSLLKYLSIWQNSWTKLYNTTTLDYFNNSATSLNANYYCYALN